MSSSCRVSQRGRLPGWRENQRLSRAANCARESAGPPARAAQTQSAMAAPKPAILLPPMREIYLFNLPFRVRYLGVLSRRPYFPALMGTSAGMLIMLVVFASGAILYLKSAKRLREEQRENLLNMAS